MKQYHEALELIQKTGKIRTDRTGAYHRIDGPAIYGGNQPTEWWLYGNYFKTMNEWLEANDQLDENEKLIFKLQYG